jgi:hypothetical protein
LTLPVEVYEILKRFNDGGESPKTPNVRLMHALSLPGKDDSPVKRFEISDVLAVITGRMVSTRYMEGMLDIMRFILREPGMTEYCAEEARQVCREWLLTQFPDLENIHVTGLSAKNWGQWLKEMSDRFGVVFDVLIMPKSQCQSGKYSRTVWDDLGIGADGRFKGGPRVSPPPSFEGKDYYAVLGVPSDADLATIKAAYRRAALRFHPDHNKAPDAEDRFKEAAEAYQVLSNEATRWQYDQLRSAA